MALYAISDLHLDFSGDKPMNVFGQFWDKHDEKIKNNWLNHIKDEDTVLIAGDISWSINIEDGKKDLDWVHELPGRKIISKGNHDYWWTSINKLNNMYEKISFIQNNFFTYKDYAICGTRGWISRDFDGFDEHDDKIYNREILRLKLSLDSAVKAGYNKIIVMIHYPPFNDKYEDSEFTDVVESYGVEKVIYGHIHGPALKNVNGYFVKNNVEYILTSCDYLNFEPIEIKLV
ncbi:metallophosphoesterase [Clostridium neuense]|uniref:Metallophosphoesterase n=1 Tax=Clostridium neuense TaxID=1728934 RepID=A0ABW8TBU8_9CLOT